MLDDTILKKKYSYTVVYKK